MDLFNIIKSAIDAVSPAATAIGVGIAAWQLRMSKNQARSEFEDGFAEQYRGILDELPLRALLGKSLEQGELQSALRAFYRYFDLCNEQAFLAAHHRIRPETWANRLEGIQQNYARQAFRQAWDELLPDLDGSFDDLRRHLPRDSPRKETDSSKITVRDLKTDPWEASLLVACNS